MKLFHFLNWAIVSSKPSITYNLRKLLRPPYYVIYNVFLTSDASIAIVFGARRNEKYVVAKTEGASEKLSHFFELGHWFQRTKYYC